jgi:polyphosphate kinase 2 (PPK2 family)
VLVVRVHPALLAQQRLPALGKNESIWKRRFGEITCFERYLVRNGIVVLKFFLNISKQEQKSRFLKRIERKEKNWKFSAADIRERQYWDDYMEAYEEMFNQTLGNASSTGSGAAEELVAEATVGRRDELFLAR